MREHLRTFLGDKARRYRIEKWCWAAQIPIALALVLFDRHLWDAISIPYVAGLSIYALVITASGAEQAADAAQQATALAEGDNQ